MARPLCRARLICTALVTTLLIACGSSGSDPVATGDPEDPPPPPPPPPAPEAPENPILYIANQEDPNRFELWLIDPDAPGDSARVNGTLAGGGNVGPYALSPDLTHAAYIADQQTDGVAELFIVDLAEPGASTKLNAALVADGDVSEFRFSPDGTQVVYLADQAVDGQTEGWLVDVASPGVATRVNSDLIAGGELVDGIQFSPDGTQVLYAADQDTFGVFELYLVEVASPGVSTKVHPAFGPDVELASGYHFSPDGTTIGYMSDQDTDEVRELYAVDVSNLGVSSKLNGALIAGGDLCDFKFSPDSTHVAYCADQDTDGTLELYLVELAVPGVSAKLNSPLVMDGNVSAQSYEFGPDGDFLVYRADQETDEMWELFRVERTMPGTTTKVSDTMIAEGDVPSASGEQPSFRISPDGLQLTYIADQDTDEVFEVYNVDLSTPGVSTTLSPPMASDGAELLDTTADSLQVIYMAEQDSDADELYRVEIAAPGAATKLNDNLVGGGEVFDFSIAPGLRLP